MTPLQGLLDPEPIIRNSYNEVEVGKIFQVPGFFHRNVSWMLGASQSKEATIGRRCLNSLKVYEKSSFIVRHFLWPVRWILELNDRQSLATANQYLKCFYELEFIPVRTDGKDKMEYIYWKKSVEKIKKYCKESVVPELKNLAAEFEQAEISMEYRIDASNRSEEKIDEELAHELVCKAQEWKLAPTQRHLPSRELSTEEINIVKSLASYPKMARFMLGHEESFHNFCKYTIQRRNLGPHDVDYYVQFPGMRAYYKTILATKTRGAVVVDSSSGQKEVKLPFTTEKPDGSSQVEYISMLDPKKEVTLKNGWRRTIGEITEELQKKTEYFERMDFTPVKEGNSGREAGFISFNNLEMGSWNPKTNSYDRIQLKNKKGEYVKEWWEQLPDEEVFTLEEAQKKFGPELDGKMKGRWLRFNQTCLDKRSPDGQHGWLSVVYPTPDGKYYKVRSFSKYNHYWPTTLWQKIWGFANTDEGRIVRDESATNTHRLDDGIFDILTDDAFDNGMNGIADTILLGWEGKLPFQLHANPCMAEVNRMGNMFQDSSSSIPPIRTKDTMMPVSKIDFDGLALMLGMRKIFDLTPEKWRGTVLKMITIPFFPWRSLNGYSLWKSDWFQNKPYGFYIAKVGEVITKELAFGNRKDGKRSVVGKGTHHPYFVEKAAELRAKNIQASAS